MLWEATGNTGFLLRMTCNKVARIMNVCNGSKIFMPSELGRDHSSVRPVQHEYKILINFCVFSTKSNEYVLLA